ncbi:MAG TPA: ATP-binding protein, partial [Holophagaceae bacterium]
PALDLWLSVSAYSPGPGEFVVMLDDINDRKRAEQALRASEARFLAVFQASPVGILVSRLSDGAILEANPAFLALTGHRAEEVRGRSSLDLGLWADPALRKEGLRLVRETGRVPILEADLCTRTGAQVPVVWATELVDLGGEQVLVNMILDQTERRRAEEVRRRLETEVAHAQKLESLGALAGGVSHDMNNVLAAIMALGSLLQERYREDPVLSKHLETLMHAAGRGRDLVKGLTDFARKDLSEPRPLDLNEVVRKEAALLCRTTLQKIQVTQDLQEGLPQVMGDPSAIQNALMNLCVNALDAMPQGGRLTLATRVEGDGHVLLSVKDTGQGMPPDVLARAMEPFFTTKPAGKGTGLGLALVYGVMTSHGGRVAITSEVGQGTDIALSFPVLAEASTARPAAPASEAGTLRRLRILLVDDDDLIRGTVPAMLEALGHQVVALGGGLEAVQRVGSGLEVDLVILDLNMPGLDGEATLERLRLLRPELPVLLATGYREERDRRILERFKAVDLLMKPFTLMELRLKLGQIA